MRAGERRRSISGAALGSAALSFMRPCSCWTRWRTSSGRSSSARRVLLRARSSRLSTSCTGARRGEQRSKERRAAGAPGAAPGARAGAALKKRWPLAPTRGGCGKQEHLPRREELASRRRRGQAVISAAQLLDLSTRDWRSAGRLGSGKEVGGGDPLFLALGRGAPACSRLRHQQQSTSRAGAHTSEQQGRWWRCKGVILGKGAGTKGRRAAACAHAQHTACSDSRRCADAQTWRVCVRARAGGE